MEEFKSVRGTPAAIDANTVPETTPEKQNVEPIAMPVVRKDGAIGRYGGVSGSLKRYQGE